MVPTIREVRFFEDYTIHVALNSGLSFLYDIKPKLQTIRFAPLKDKAFFMTGKLKNCTVIEWDEVVSLDIFELMSEKLSTNIS